MIKAKALLLLGSVLLLAACAPPAHKGKRYFWPPGGADAKIEYINFYLTDRDLLRGKENHFAEAILGVEPPKQLFQRPVGVASDGKGRVFVSDAAVRKVFVLDLNKGRARFLRDLTELDVAFAFPQDIAVAADGRIVVCDSRKKNLVVFGANERRLHEIPLVGMNRPLGIAIDDRRERILVADAGNHAVVAFTFEGEKVQTFGGRGPGQGKFNYPLDAAVDADGNIYVLDTMNSLVQKFDADGNFLLQFGERGTALGSFQVPKSLAVSPSGHLYVTDGHANRVLVFDGDGNFLLGFGGRVVALKGKTVPGGLNMPLGIAIDSNEAIWIVDSLNRMLHNFQYLNPAYLARHPIDENDIYHPTEHDLSGIPARGTAPAADGGARP